MFHDLLVKHTQLSRFSYEARELLFDYFDNWEECNGVEWSYDPSDVNEWVEFNLDNTEDLVAIDKEYLNNRWDYESFDSKYKTDINRLREKLCDNSCDTLQEGNVILIRSYQ
jgi:hypothetical protein